MTVACSVAVPAEDRLPPAYYDRPAAPSIADDMAEIIAARTMRGLDCTRSYLRTLGYPEATLAENYELAQAAALEMIERAYAAMRYGIG